MLAGCAPASRQLFSKSNRVIFWQGVFVLHRLYNVKVLWELNLDSYLRSCWYSRGITTKTTVWIISLILLFKPLEYKCLNKSINLHQLTHSLTVPLAYSWRNLLFCFIIYPECMCVCSVSVCVCVCVCVWSVHVRVCGVQACVYVCVYVSLFYLFTWEQVANDIKLQLLITITWNTYILLFSLTKVNMIQIKSFGIFHDHHFKLITWWCNTWQDNFIS